MPHAHADCSSSRWQRRTHECGLLTADAGVWLSESGQVTADATLRDRWIGETAALFRPAGRFAYHFAHGKLRNDPLFTTLLRLNVIPDAARLVDLGCGQGLLGAWLIVARRPDLDCSPRRIDAYVGVDQSVRDLARAKTALPDAHLIEADLRAFDLQSLAPCDVITLFDVLHYLELPAQERLLAGAHAALGDDGTMILRVGDAASSSASRWSNAIDSVVCALRGHPHARLHRRSIADWSALLDGIGFTVEILDDDRQRKRTAFANVVLRARKRGVR